MSPKKALLRSLAGEKQLPPPMWFMRQAGRYLPEYRKLRAGAGSFLDLCMAPELAAEVTLQPIKRFAMDGTILFSDILIVPLGLGMDLKFVEGRGPVLSPLVPGAPLPVYDPQAFRNIVGSIYDTVSLVKEQMPADTTLIGFCGGPWTVATYMVEGGSSRDFAKTKAWSFEDPDGFQAIIDVIEAASIDYLLAQVAAGAEVLKIFDSWAGVLSPASFARWVSAPTGRIVAAVRAVYPDIPIIGFPRAAGPSYVDYVKATGVDAVAVDTTLSMPWAAAYLQPLCPVQGNLDPLLLVAGGDALRQAVDDICTAMADGPFIFNLGHGIVPQTPIAHVEQVVAQVRQFGQ